MTRGAERGEVGGRGEVRGGRIRVGKGGGGFGTYGKLIKARHARKRIIRNGSGSYYQLSPSYEHMNKRTYRV